MADRRYEYDKNPFLTKRYITERDAEIFGYVKIQNHSIKEAEAEFGITANAIHVHIRKFQELTPLPTGFIEMQQNVARQLGAEALKVIEEHFRGKKPDVHAAIKVAKGVGILSDMASVDVTYRVKESPEVNLGKVAEEIAKRVKKNE